MDVAGSAHQRYDAYIHELGLQARSLYLSVSLSALEILERFLCLSLLPPSLSLGCSLRLCVSVFLVFLCLSVPQVTAPGRKAGDASIHSGQTLHSVQAPLNKSFFLAILLTV